MTSAAAAQALVMADTCIWIDAEKDPMVAARLIELTSRDRVVICGVIYAEILRGLQDPTVRERRARQLLALQSVETPPELWRKTAEMAQAQDRRGHPVPLTDVHVAALCVENEFALWTTDRHFDRIPGVSRYRVG